MEEENEKVVEETTQETTEQVDESKFESAGDDSVIKVDLSKPQEPKQDEVKKDNSNWIVKTNNGKSFSTPNVIIAGGVGSFEPRKFSPKECEKFENKSIFYSVKDKNIFKGKKEIRWCRD